MVGALNHSKEPAIAGLARAKKTPFWTISPEIDNLWGWAQDRRGHPKNALGVLSGVHNSLHWISIVLPILTLVFRPL